jgi:CubicO group peptidase (beta-lactamase class C family)
MKNTFTSNQLFSLITMTIVAIWGVWVSWLHLTRPMGADHMEFLFLSAMVPIYLILLPFYGLRVRWSYISGIIVLLGLFAGLMKTVVDQTFFFSLSAYNLTTVAVFLNAATCIFFSLRSYLELPPVGWVKSTFGIGVLLVVSTLAVWQISAKQMKIENDILKRVIHGVQTRMGDIGELDEKIEVLMAEGDIPSMVAAIVIKDETVWLQEYGEQVDLDDLYNIGSITKSFVATSILQLYERGQIALDDDINQYLPFEVRHPDYLDVPITIRMLLTNRSCLSDKSELYFTYFMGTGLRQWAVEKRGWDYRGEFETLSYADFMLEYLEPGGLYYQPENWTNCQPGTNFVYSTPGFDLLGFLVEQVSRQPLNDYLQENIFVPLEMNSTTATPLNTPARVAIPYERWYGVLANTNVQLPIFQRRMLGGGGLYSTAGDLSNFLLAQMNQGGFDDYQLLQPETVSLMHSSASQVSGDFMQIGYGYGWGIYQKEPRQMWDITFHPRGYQGHGGRTWGYSSAMYMVEENQGAYGYILLMNHSMVESMDFPWVFSIQFNIQDLILGEAYRIYQASLNQ